MQSRTDESDAHLDGNSIRLANAAERFGMSAHQIANPTRTRLNPVDAQAIARFLGNGGRVTKVDSPVTATEQEVIDFLAMCGVTARYMPGDMRAYWCNNRRYSMTEMVRLANVYRCKRQLAPFAIRLIASTRGK